MKTLVCALLFVSLLRAPFTQVSADESHALCGRVNQPGGTILGRLLNDSTGEPVSERGVLLGGDNIEWCVARTDSAGRYSFHHIPAGQYELHVGGLGYRRVRPIAVNIAGDTVMPIDVRMRPENGVADCLELAHCAELLRVEPRQGVLSDSQQIRETVFRTTIALAFAESDSLASWIPCIDESSPRVIEQLRTRIHTVVHVSQCVGVFPRDRVTGSDARRFRIEHMSIFPGDSAVVESGYQANPVHGTGWRCRYLRARRLACYLVWNHLGFLRDSAAV